MLYVDPHQLRKPGKPPAGHGAASAVIPSRHKLTTTSNLNVTSPSTAPKPQRNYDLPRSFSMIAGSCHARGAIALPYVRCVALSTT